MRSPPLPPRVVLVASILLLFTLGKRLASSPPAPLDRSDMVCSSRYTWPPLLDKALWLSHTRISRCHKLWKHNSVASKLEKTNRKEGAVEVKELKHALKYLDAAFFNDTKVQEMAQGAMEFNVPMFRVNRELVASSDGGLNDPSVLVFNSSWGSNEAPHTCTKFAYPSMHGVQLPKKEEDIAFMTVLELGELIRNKQITSQELTDIFIRRLKRYNPVLETVVTLTEELAYNQAKKADELLAQGVYLGPLHGIPYGLKDIIAVPHYKTTWGSRTFKDQVLNIEAWVYRKLKSAGAVLVAKLVSGSLAYDDIWFGGRTRNPWNIKEFSTGSSAGPAASASAGPLHGIPYGLKDIIAVPHYKTTWGSRTFKDQVLNIEAWVYRKLKSAGAVLVAKLVSGSLAYDDIWFGGRTRNPWNIKEFSTGSSAGPAASASAGLVPFAIGSETAGSLTYPAARCGVTCLRPTFGTVGRSGVMSISESLDKLGPFCRSAADCALVIDAIRGKDPADLSSRHVDLQDPFQVDIKKLTVGYLKDAEMEVVRILQSKGVNCVPFELKYTIESVQAILNFTMDVDMLSHFDKWQRLGHDDEYEAQDQWPVELRRARLIPAVDYIQAQRARGKLIREVRESFTVDAFIGNATDWEKVCLGNLVGIPVLVVPTGFKSVENDLQDGTKRRTTITTGIYAPPDHDHIALALAMAYQSATNHHRQRPPIDDV